MVTVAQLKECPFCGHQIQDLDDCLHPTNTVWATSQQVGRHYFNRKSGKPYEGQCWEIGCVENEGGCGATMTGDSQLDVIEKWNRRS